MAIGTLASLNWNLEQAIEAHLMQEDKNDDEDPEILETIPAAASGRNAGASSSSRFEPEVINIELVCKLVGGGPRCAHANA